MQSQIAGSTEWLLAPEQLAGILEKAIAPHRDSIILINTNIFSCSRDRVQETISFYYKALLRLIVEMNNCFRGTRYSIKLNNEFFAEKKEKGGAQVCWNNFAGGIRIA